MKIACIGNMNNAMFAIVRNLRDLNYDAHLFLVEEFDHFLPLADTYDDILPDYVHQLNWYNIGHWAISKEKIKKDLEGFDFFIGTDLAPAFLIKAGIELDIFTPHGGDIFKHCYYSFENFPPKKHEIGAWYRSYHQRKGARRAKYIMFDITNDSNELYFKTLNLQKNRLFINAPYIYPKQYTEQTFIKNKEYEKAKLIRAKYDLVLFHQSRHVWKTHIDSLHYKANDRIIRGYAKFLAENSSSKSLLIMFEYGWDFQDSKNLVTELGISEKVLWLPIMPRKDLMVWLSIADMGIGEVANSWFSYGSVYEVLCSQKPFLGYRKDDDFKTQYPEQYPMVSANTEELICIALNDLKSNPLHYKEMGEKGYDWFMKFAINRPINEIIKQIEAKKVVLDNNGFKKNLVKN